MAVQLIAGKTLCKSSNDDDDDDGEGGAALIRRLQTGQLVLVQGQTNVQSRSSLNNWIDQRCLDIVVHSYQVLQERDAAVDEAFAAARAQQKMERRKRFAAPQPQLGVAVDPVDPATCLRLDELYGNFNNNATNMTTTTMNATSSAQDSSSSSPPVILVDHMQAVKAFAGDLSQLLTSLQQTSKSAGDGNDNDGNDKPSPSPLPLVGIDCEWQPNFLLASTRDPQPVLLLQICLHPLQRIYLFDLQTLLRPMMPPSQSMDKLEKEVSFALGALFESKRLIKVGFQVVHDLRQLAASYPHIPSLQFYNAVLESSTLGKKTMRMAKLGNAREATSSLTRLVRRFLGKSLNKQEQCSDWAARPLTEAQREYAALDAAVTPLIVDKLLQELDAQLFGEKPRLGRFLNDVSFKNSITSWRFVFVDTTDPNAQRKLKAKRVVADELVVSQSWTTGEVPPKLPALPAHGSDGPYVDTSGILQVPSPTVSIRTDKIDRIVDSMLGQPVGKSKDKCVSAFLQGSAALPADAQLNYNQRSGFVEFRDGVALFVNMPHQARGQPRSYPNEWLDDGRILTWFLRENDWKRGESDLARKLTDSSQNLVTLFVRMGSTGTFLCCGRCRVETDSSSSSAVSETNQSKSQESTTTTPATAANALPDNWTLVELRLVLLDWKQLSTTCTDFQNLVQGRDPVS